MEAALNTLIDSMTTLNPSPQAAVDLVAADDEFSKGLEQLAQHQNNYATILRLRQETEALDNQIKSTVTLLAETRKELLAIPSNVESETPRHDVPFDQLLTYAKMISQYTVPPTYRPNAPKLREESKLPEVEPGAGVALTNGGTPHSQVIPQGPPELEGAVKPVEEKSGKGLAYDKLTTYQKEFVDDMSHLPFYPWPSTDIIRMGALAKIQEMLNKGEDPTTVLTEEEKEEQERRRREESEARKLEDQERRKERAQQGGAAVGGSRPKQAEIAFEGFDLYDPDQEMDDDD